MAPLFGPLAGAGVMPVGGSGYGTPVAPSWRWYTPAQGAPRPGLGVFYAPPQVRNEDALPGSFPATSAPAPAAGPVGLQLTEADRLFGPFASLGPAFAWLRPSRL
jgi:hypothetical protein